MRGKGNNGPLSSLYIQLATGTSGGTSSTAVSIDNFSSRALDEDWQNVNIAISDFNFGANLSSVRRLIIGSTGTGGGLLWIDDIRLYVSRCVEQADRVPAADLPLRADAPLADITNDCVVDGSDLYEVTDAWLDSDTTVSANGVVNSATAATQWVAGQSGNGLQLGAPMDWVDIDDLAFKGDPNNFNKKTVAMWVRIDDTPGPAVETKQMIFSTSNSWRLHILAESTDADSSKLRAMVGNLFAEPTPIGNTIVDEGTWHHVAITVGAPSGGLVTCSFYVDGANKVSQPSIDAHYYNELTGACLGGLNNGTSQHIDATVDDFRIYNRALTDSEVLALKNGTNPAGSPPLIKFDFSESSGTTVANTGSISTVNHPVGYVLKPLVKVSPAELYTGTDGGKTYINMKDYAKLATTWLYGNSGEWVFP
jgi:hypothetical protein